MQPVCVQDWMNGATSTIVVGRLNERCNQDTYNLGYVYIVITYNNLTVRNAEATAPGTNFANQSLVGFRQCVIYALGEEDVCM